MYAIGTEDDYYVLTQNVVEAEELVLPTTISGMQKTLGVYFSTTLEDRVLCIYLKYSDGSIKDILIEIQADEEFRKQVYTSVKKVIRLKICLGLL